MSFRVLLLILVVLSSLQGTTALPVLVKEGELLNKKKYFIDTPMKDIHTISISKDGTKIAIGYRDNSVKIWSTQSSELIQHQTITKPYVNKIGTISIDNSKIVSCSTINNYNMKIWDSKNEKLLLTLKNKGYVDSVSFSPDGSKIVSGSRDDTIKIWNSKSGKLLLTLKGHKDNVNCVAFSPDGKKIISGSDDNTIKIWNSKSGKLLQTLIGHKSNIISVFFSQNGSKIISDSYDRTIRIWDSKNGKLLQTIIGQTRGANIIFDGTKVISSERGNTINIWDTKSGKLLRTIKSDVSHIAVSTNSNNIISYGYDSTIKIWDSKSGGLLQILKGHKNSVISVAISKDESRIVSGSNDKTIKIWDTKNGKLLKILIGHKGSIGSIAITPDGTKIISGSADNTIKIWDTKNGKLLNNLIGHKGSIKSIAITPDGTKIISGSDDNTIKIWDIKSAKLLSTLKGHEYSIKSITITPDGIKIISGSGDNTIKIWSIKNGKLLKTLKGHKNAILSLVISTDGDRIISGSADNTVKIWNTNSGKLLKTLKGHLADITSVAISTDNNKIISGSVDRTIKIWDAKNGKLLKTLIRHKDDVESVAISIDNREIISSSKDGTIKILNMKNGIIIKELVGGRDGSWVTFDYKNKKIFRGDNGDMLLVKDGVNLSPLLPPNLAKEDKVELSLEQKHLTIRNDHSKELSITVKNLSKKSLYWLGGRYHDEYFTLLKKILPVLEPEKLGTLTFNVKAHLPRVNPKPIKDHIVELKLKSATKSKFVLKVPISISFADIIVKKAFLSEDKKVLNLDIKNIGDENLTDAKVKLLEPFKADVQEISLLDTNQTKTLSYTLPKGFEFKDEQSIKLSVYIPNLEEKDAYPLYEWNIDGVKIALPEVSLLTYILLLGFILFLGFMIYWYKRYKNPVVLKLARDETQLYNFDIDELEMVKDKLYKIDRFEPLLKSLNIDQNSFQKAIKFSKKPDVGILAEKLDVKSYKSDDFYQMKWLENNFELNMDNFLLYMTDKQLVAIQNTLESKKDEKVLVISINHQDELSTYSHDKTNRVIAPTSKELTKLLLAPDTKEVFIEILSKCLSFKYLSPYQLKGGVKNEANFFGRVEIIRDIISRERANYLIVGARQLGKSSILEALDRRYKANSEVKSYYITLDESGDILRDMSSVLSLAKDSTLEDIVEAINNIDKKVVFLIDEADKFIEFEKQRDYHITSSFRKLSQEGKAIFVLAGFWKLYEHVALDYQSPLKNFGEVIKLEGLDDEACRDVMVKPMQRVGVSYENQTIITNLIKRCGNRANLIATVCDEVLKNLDGRVITQKDIDKVIDSGSIDPLLHGWQGLTANKKQNQLDRIIVYLTVELDSFRLGNIVKLIEKNGLEIDTNLIQESLDRLVLGYVFKKRKGVYTHIIPLFKEILLDDDIEFLLSSEVKKMRG